MIGTRTWWKQQFALAVAMTGVVAAVAGAYLLLRGGGSGPFVLLLAGLVTGLLAGAVWKRYARQNAVDQLERNLYGPD